MRWFLAVLMAMFGGLAVVPAFAAEAAAPVDSVQLKKDAADLMATIGAVLSWSNSEKAIATGMVQELSAGAKGPDAQAHADFVIQALSKMFSEQGSLMSVMSIDDIKTVWAALRRLPADLATLDHVSTAITAAVTMYNQRGGSPGALFADFLKQPEDSSELKLYGTTDHFTWSTPAYWETDEGDSSEDGAGNSGGSGGSGDGGGSSGETPKPAVVHQVHASGRITATSPVGGVTNGTWSMEYDALSKQGSVSVNGTINGQSGGYSFNSCGGGSASSGSVSFAVCGTMMFGKTVVDISGYSSASAGGGFSLHIDGRAGSQTASVSVSGETKVFMSR